MEHFVTYSLFQQVAYVSLHKILWMNLGLE
jgi:hypothetical protein